MNDEIKEILDNLKDEVWSKTGADSYDKLLDYITNLQQENERLKKENKYLDELRNANYLSWQDSLSRIEKAVEILKDTNVDMPSTLLIETIDNGVKILNSRSDE